MPNAGDPVGERYRLTEELASGGMGTIWAAEHLELGTRVAIKLMNQDLGADPAYQRRFQREARIVAKLKSPHIVSVLDFGFWNAQPYLVMELLQGEDLASRIERSPIERVEVLAILEGVSKALDLAHEAGVVHRDIKPSNIFLARVGDEVVAKVLDFGIARVSNANTTGQTTDHGFAGSPAYMSPEQVWGEALGPPSDRWSLGVVAFEMLTRHSPFDGGPLAKTFDRIIRSDLPKVTSHCPELPSAVDEALGLALRRDPKERVGSAKEFVGALKEALEISAVPHQTSVTPGRSHESDPSAATLPNDERPRARGPSIAVIGVALGALALGVIALLAFLDAPTSSAGNVSASVTSGVPSEDSTGQAEVTTRASPLPSAAPTTQVPSSAVREGSSSFPVRASTPRTNATSRPVGLSTTALLPTGAPTTDSTFGIPQSAPKR